MNPWISIWTKPRQTISHIVQQNPNRSLWALAFIYGFCSLMNMFQSMVLGNSLGLLGILVLVLVLAPLWGYVNFTVWSWVVHVVGKWFKGQGRFTEVRAAYAWSSVPLAINIPLWLLMVVLFGHQLFLNYPDAQLMPNSIVVFLFALLIARMVLAVWSLVIYLNALAEVQKYSILRAIFNLLVAAVILGVLMFVLWSLLLYGMGHGMAVTLWKPF